MDESLGAQSHEYLVKIGAGGVKELVPRLPCQCLGQKCLPHPRRPRQQDSLGYLDVLPAQAGSIPDHAEYLPHFFHFFVHTDDVSKPLLWLLDLEGLFVDGLVEDAVELGQLDLFQMGVDEINNVAEHQEFCVT